jgi:hypothetical protein
LNALGAAGIPRPWPQARTIQAALQGRIREVFRTENGESVAGVRSVAPWVFLALGDVSAVVCSRCLHGEPLPRPPQAQTGAGVAQGDLFGVLTRDYALYLLTSTLHPFFRKHENCERGEAPQAMEEPAA